MKMRGQEWGNVFNASGARGFFGEGYWYHKPLSPFGLNYEGSTFVAKTTTVSARPGNMPLTDQHSPKDLVPKCIVVKPLEGVVLNSVGLSGPGARVLVNRWLSNPTPIGPTLDDTKVVHSFMSVDSVEESRLAEARVFVELMKPVARNTGKYCNALQINFSCPNVGLDPQKLATEITSTLEIAKVLEIPLMVKINALFPVEAIVEIANSCDAIVVSNTIPWGKLPNDIDWKGLFGSDTSPLAHLGGGGLSGKPLLKIVERWITKAKQSGVKCPIVGGGGILSHEDAFRLLGAGAEAVELGSVSILRPWRVQKIIKKVNYYCGLRERLYQECLAY